MSNLAKSQPDNKVSTRLDPEPVWMAGGSFMTLGSVSLQVQIARGSSLKSAPTRFKTHEEYVETFRPLVMEVGQAAGYAIVDPSPLATRRLDARSSRVSRRGCTTAILRNWSCIFECPGSPDWVLPVEGLAKRRSVQRLHLSYSQCQVVREER